MTDKVPAEPGYPRPRVHEVIVRQVGRVTMSEGGLYLPDAKHYRNAAGDATGAQRDEYPPRGKVEAVGLGVFDVKVGDEIYFARETEAKNGTSCRALIPEPAFATEAEHAAWDNLLVMNEANILLVFEVST